MKYDRNNIIQGGSEVLLPIKIKNKPKMFDETETERKSVNSSGKDAVTPFIHLHSSNKQVSLSMSESRQWRLGSTIPIPHNFLRTTVKDLKLKSWCQRLFNFPISCGEQGILEKRKVKISSKSAESFDLRMESMEDQINNLSLA
ncbi:hypothetical protein ACTFIW_010311 [Dictyostelium discoideum]